MESLFDIKNLKGAKRWEALRFMHIIRMMKNEFGRAKRRKARKLERQNRKKGRR